LSYAVTAIVRAARLSRVEPPLQHRPELKAILLGLADRCHDDGGSAWPSVATLANEAEVSPRTAQKLLAVLVASGLIHEERRATQHRPRTYRLDLLKLVGLADPQHVAPLEMKPATQHVAPLNGASKHLAKHLAKHPRPAESAPDPQKSSPGPQHVAPDPVLMNRPLNGHTRAPEEELPGLQEHQRLCDVVKALAWEATSQEDLLERVLALEKLDRDSITAAHVASTCSFQWAGRTLGTLTPRHAREARSRVGMPLVAQETADGSPAFSAEAADALSKISKESREM
jgi:hypothetical protein